MAIFFVFSDVGGFEANSVDTIYSYLEKWVYLDFK